MIDRSRTKLDLSSCRKSFWEFILWKWITSENYTDSTIEEFRKFHIDVAGKETRNQATLKLQGELIKNKQGFIVRSEYQGKLAGISFYQYGTQSVLYGVGVYDRSLMEQNLPIAHSSLFYAIKEAKKIGLESLIMGDVNVNNANTKEAQIAKFKKGFVNQCLSIPNYKVELNF